jgi:5-methylcytosine-specific restriction endonuclease McrA
MPNRPSNHQPAVPSRQTLSTRLSANDRGYTYRWQQYSRAFLGEHPLCFYCELLGLVTAAEHTDHYNPAEPNTEAFWDPKNHRASCARHNTAKRAVAGDRYVEMITIEARGGGASENSVATT